MNFDIQYIIKEFLIVHRQRLGSIATFGTIGLHHSSYLLWIDYFTVYREGTSSFAFLAHRPEGWLRLHFQPLPNRHRFWSVRFAATIRDYLAGNNCLRGVRFYQWSYFDVVIIGRVVGGHVRKTRPFICHFRSWDLGSSHGDGRKGIMYVDVLSEYCD